MAIAKVTAGDQIKATDHNILVDEVNSKASKSEITTAVNTAVSGLVGSEPETLDTLEEIATALTSNNEVIDTLNAAIGSKADKTATETAISSINTKLLTSDKHTSVAWDATTQSLVITYKDGTKTTTPISTKAVYA